MAGKIQNKNLLSYLDYTKQPWGKLFYKIISNSFRSVKAKGFSILAADSALPQIIWKNPTG